MTEVLILLFLIMLVLILILFVILADLAFMKIMSDVFMGLGIAVIAGSVFRYGFGSHSVFLLVVGLGIFFLLVGGALRVSWEMIHESYILRIRRKIGVGRRARKSEIEGF